MMQNRQICCWNLGFQPPGPSRNNQTLVRSIKLWSGSLGSMMSLIHLNLVVRACTAAFYAMVLFFFLRLLIPMRHHGILYCVLYVHLFHCVRAGLSVSEKLGCHSQCLAPNSRTVYKALVWFFWFDDDFDSSE